MASLVIKFDQLREERGSRLFPASNCGCLGIQLLYEEISSSGSGASKEFRNGNCQT